MEIRRCVNCMEDMSGQSGSVCPVCGCDNAKAAEMQPPYAMRQNAIIHGRYLIGKVLGQGGFGITYIGLDMVLNVKVAIKEYFPMGMATREQSRSNTLIWSPTQVNTQQRQDGYENFLKEARKIAKIDSIPSIVRVRDTFLENETAYIVMDFVEGITLKDKLARSGLMSVSECIGLLKPMMEGLAQVHKMGIIHRDISPDNIIVQPDGKLKLLDLGAAKDMSSGQNQSQLVTKNGFSPLEQYTQSGQIGPWTDVYALCATIYYCITGKMIPSALDRMGNDTIAFPQGLKEPVPPQVETALRQGLAIDARNRIPSVDVLLEYFQGTNAQKQTDLTGKKKDGNKKVFIGAAVAVSAILVLVAAVFLFLFLAGLAGGGKDDDSQSADSSSEADVTQGSETAGGETENTGGLRVVQLGTESANLLNYGGDAMFEEEYEYFIAGDDALYVCPYNAENQAFYPNDEAEKVCDFGAYITLSDTEVYFLTSLEDTNAVCRMDKDGSNIEQLYSVTDGRDFSYLQYAKLSDQKEYLYFMLENEEGGNFASLYRYDLETKETEMVIEGDLNWYNLYDDGIYYTEVAAADDAILRLVKTGLAGENEKELDYGKDFATGFFAEDALYLLSLRDEAVLVYDLDGMPKSGYEGFYDLEIDFNYSLGYGNGWIYYVSKTDQSIHRVRANGTGDSVFLEGHTAIQLCYRSRWLWFIEAGTTEKYHQYANQMYYVGKDGSGLFAVQETHYTWGLESANPADFQYEESVGGIIITGYTGGLTSFSIPDSIGGKTVIGIGERAFEGSSVEEIGLPDGVRTIEPYAFYECGNLTFVGLSEGLESIEEGAFGECWNLEYADLPESLTYIGKLAFADTALSQVYIPSGLDDIGAGAFAIPASAGLTEFTVSEDNAKFFADDGALYTYYDGDTLILIACPSGYSGSFEVLEGTDAIYYYAFAYCKNMTEITIPESVLIVGTQAFFEAGVSEITVNESCRVDEDLGSEITVNYY